jgi:hypothetical protein
VEVNCDCQLSGQKIAKADIAPVAAGREAADRLVHLVAGKSVQ